MKLTLKTSAWIATAVFLLLSIIYSVAGKPDFLAALGGMLAIATIVLWVLVFRRGKATSSTASSRAVTPTNTVQLRRGSGAVVAVGEQHYPKSLRKAHKLAADPDHVTVALVPDPHNAHDANAVRLDILIGGTSYPAGHIAAEYAERYSRVLRPLAERGLVGIGDGKIRIDQSGNFQVYARLSDNPNILVPPAIEDPLGEFVDGTFDLAVTGEEAYQDTIKRHAHRVYPIPFALHSTTIEKGKYEGLSTFAVYLDGEVVGQLTRAMAEKHSHALDSVVRSGKRPYLAGRIEQDHRGHQVILDGPSALPAN